MADSLAHSDIKKDNKRARPSDSGQVTFIVFALSERLQGLLIAGPVGVSFIFNFGFNLNSLAKK